MLAFFPGTSNHDFNLVSSKFEWLYDRVSSFSPSRRSSCLWPIKAMLVPEEGDSHAFRNLLSALDIRLTNEVVQLSHCWLHYWLLAYAPERLSVCTAPACGAKLAYWAGIITSWPASSICSLALSFRFTGPHIRHSPPQNLFHTNERHGQQRRVPSCHWPASWLQRHS